MYCLFVAIVVLQLSCVLRAANIGPNRLEAERYRRALSTGECTAGSTCTGDDYSNPNMLPLAGSGCSKFCQCATSDTSSTGYIWVEQTCSPPLLFSTASQVCDWPANVDCQD
ncbi:uncharacterized protein LOC123537533 [Mercenaria mercenaria]|uniref:uncharacterized protein LOC123537533 n=1 Tax=Mercenaria mercenaria TaxID=6596 RepID=UPI00234ED51C|nr:uncharacterized protein LOC123537533 [Mercenaria mercenaria]